MLPGGRNLRQLAAFRSQGTGATRPAHCPKRLSGRRTLARLTQGRTRRPPAGRRRSSAPSSPNSRPAATLCRTLRIVGLFRRAPRSYGDTTKNGDYSLCMQMLGDSPSRQERLGVSPRGVARLPNTTHSIPPPPQKAATGLSGGLRPSAYVNAGTLRAARPRFPRPKLTPSLASIPQPRACAQATKTLQPFVRCASSAERR